MIANPKSLGGNKRGTKKKDSRDLQSDELRGLLNIIEAYPVLSDDKQLELFQQIARCPNDQALKQKAMLHNLGLCFLVAGRLARWGRGFSLEELILEGVLGLSRAVDKFELERGLKFSTFATILIRQRVHRYITEGRTTIRIPWSAQIEMAAGGKNTDSSQYLFARVVTSINQSVRGGRHQELDPLDQRDVFASVSREIPPLLKLQAFEELDLIQRRIHRIFGVVDLLLISQRDKEIFKKYSVTTPVPTFQSIATEFGITKERVRQIVERTWEDLTTLGYCFNSKTFRLELKRFEDIQSVLVTNRKLSFSSAVFSPDEEREILLAIPPRRLSRSKRPEIERPVIPDS